VWRRISKQSCA